MELRLALARKVSSAQFSCHMRLCGNKLVFIELLKGWRFPGVGLIFEGEGIHAPGALVVHLMCCQPYMRFGSRWPGLATHTITNR
jgi:hypothetical protein